MTDLPTLGVGDELTLPADCRGADRLPLHGAVHGVHHHLRGDVLEAGIHEVSIGAVHSWGGDGDGTDHSWGKAD